MSQYRIVHQLKGHALAAEIDAGYDLRRAKRQADRLLRHGGLYALVVGRMATIPAEAVYYAVGDTHRAPTKWQSEIRRN